MQSSFTIKHRFKSSALEQARVPASIAFGFPKPTISSPFMESNVENGALFNKPCSHLTISTPTSSFPCTPPKIVTIFALGEDPWETKGAFVWFEYRAKCVGKRSALVAILQIRIPTTAVPQFVFLQNLRKVVHASLSN